MPADKTKTTVAPTPEAELEEKRSKTVVLTDLLTAIVNHLGNHPDLAPLLAELKADDTDAEPA